MYNRGRKRALIKTAMCSFWLVLATGIVVAEGALSGSVAIRANDEPIPSQAFAKITGIIKNEIAKSKDKLMGMTTELDLCKKERKLVKANLEKQSAVVKDCMNSLESAKEADKKYLEERLASAKDRAKAAAKAAEEAKAALERQEKENPVESLRGKFARMQKAKEEMSNIKADVRNGGPTPTEKPLRKTQEDIQEKKYELKQEIKRLKNFEKERELLHNKCINGPMEDKAAGDRFEKRLDEIENLKSAYTILDKDPKSH